MTCILDGDSGTWSWVGSGKFEDQGRPVASVWSIAFPGDYTLRLGGVEDGVALDALVFQRSDLPAPEGEGPDESATAGAGLFLENGGRITLEAEHYGSRSSLEGAEWLVVPEEDVGDVPHHNFRGSGYLQVLPDESPTFEEVLAQVEADPDSETAWYERGQLHAKMGQFAEAARDFAKVAELEPHNAYDWYLTAMAQLAAGDTESYRAACAGVLERFSETDDPNEAHWTAWTCALAPDGVSDVAQPLRLARFAFQIDDNPERHRAALGALLYRAGHFAQALDYLSDDAVREASHYSPAYAWYVMAMAHHRLGQVDEARQWFEEATAWADREIEAGASWNRRATLALLRQEAESLIYGEEMTLSANIATETDTNNGMLTADR